MGLRRRGRNRVTRCRLPTMPVTAAACGASVMMLLVVLFHCVLSPRLEEEDHSFLQRARIQGRSHLLVPHLDNKRIPFARLLKHIKLVRAIKGNHGFISEELEKSTEFQRNALAADSEEFHVPSGGVNPRIDLWSSNLSKQFYGCSTASKEFSRVGTVAEPNRYIMIATSGGLNQQRTGIIDAVVAARILNATLVIPKLDEKSFWKDASTFSEIFDVDWFISLLKYDVKIVKEIPKKGGKTVAAPYTMRVPRKCTPKCYQSRVLPALMKKHVVQLTKYDYRLSNNLEPDLQKLRCRVNYHALKFTDPIRQMGNMLVQRMRSRSTRFIAIHLRFEPDMLAFSGCYYGGGEKERTELGAIRKRWKTLHVNDPDKERRHGKCPLTPKEVALMLRALGFSDEVHLYVASGEVYGGNVTLAPLKALFPNIHSKETLLSRDELLQFEPFSSRMAALDFIVCDESDVFVTNNNGNMARMLAGRRRYFGHKRTIRPNAKKLSSLFQNQSSLTWDAFQSKVRAFQKGFMGEPGEIKAGRGEFHENPVACICDKNRKSNKSASEFLENDDGLDYRDLDYGENEPLGRSRSDGSSGLDGDNLLTQLDEAESDEFDFGQ